MEHSTCYSGSIADDQQQNKLGWDEVFDLICLLLEREFVVASNGNENWIFMQQYDFLRHECD
jgi:hypothetical protein